MLAHAIATGGDRTPLYQLFPFIWRCEQLDVAGCFMFLCLISPILQVATPPTSLRAEPRKVALVLMEWLRT